MAKIGLCKNDECENKDKCFRYKSTQGEVINFKEICNEENEYKWFWKIKENKNDKD